MATKCSKCGRKISRATAMRYGGMGPVCGGFAPSKKRKRRPLRFSNGRTSKYVGTPSIRGGSGGAGNVEDFSAENRTTPVELLTIWYDLLEDTTNLHYLYGDVAWTNAISRSEALRIVEIIPPASRDRDRMELHFSRETATWTDTKHVPQVVLDALELFKNKEFTNEEF